MSDMLPQWSRPPFESGNELAVKHGAYSARHLQPVAEKLTAAVLADLDLNYLHAPSYRPALEAWAATEARVILLEQWISEMTLAAQADSKQKTSYLELLRQWEASALTHRSRLGLDPLSRARLGRDVTAMKVDAVRLLTNEREHAEGAHVDE